MATIVIEDWMIRDEKLSGTPLLAFALIHGCTQKGEGCWYGGYERLAERVGVTERSAINSVKLLIESGRVEKTDGVIDGKARKVLRSCVSRGENFSGENFSGEKISCETGEKNSGPSNSKEIKENIEKSIYNIPEKKSKIFVKPSVTDVEQYCSENGYNIDAERFVDYYESKGWVIGSKSPMKDWQAAVRTWVKNNKRDGWNLFQQQPEQPADTDWLVEGKRYRKEEFEGHENELYSLNIELIRHVKRGGALTWKDGKFIIAK